MSRTKFYQQLEQELNRLDTSGSAKRREMVIESFDLTAAPRAIIDHQPYTIFNSNDYLGLRFHPVVKQAEQAASDRWGTGPGAVRFISGTLQIYRELEQAIAQFHGREDAMIFSSAFAANLAVISALVRGRDVNSLIDKNVLVISDQLNHRSIIDGIRMADTLPATKTVFKHLDLDDLSQILREGSSNFQRAIVVTDGVFSMLGEYQDLARLRQLVDQYDAQYAGGVLLIVDDCHGIGALGPTGRGCEEECHAHSDLLVGTLGKAMGSGGGYVTGDKILMDYLRETSSPYIYSSPISPGTAGAALAAICLLDSPVGQDLIQKLRENVKTFRELAAAAGLRLATNSAHPIQPLLIGDTLTATQMTQSLLSAGWLVTAVNYPVVPPGRDEIRIQLSARHTADDLRMLVRDCAKFMSPVPHE